MGGGMDREGRYVDLVLFGMCSRRHGCCPLTVMAMAARLLVHHRLMPSGPLASLIWCVAAVLAGRVAAVPLRCRTAGWRIPV